MISGFLLCLQGHIGSLSFFESAPKMRRIINGGALKERSSPSCFEQETGRILFREYCFGEENSLSLTEFYGELGEFCKKLGEFAFAHE